MEIVVSNDQFPSGIDTSSKQTDNNEIPPWRPLKRIFAKTKASAPADTQRNALMKMPRPIQAGAETPEEARKHAREYEEMVKSFEERERKKELMKQRNREMRDKRMEECKKAWLESDILSNWENRKHQRKTQELVFKGIPPRVRTAVWPLMLGNKLQLTAELFQIYVAQASRMKDIMQGKELGKEESLKVIELDLPRTFPALSFFQPDGPLHSQLRQVLEAYVSYRPDIGYVQGMSFLASMLLLVMDTFDSFKCLANLLNRPLFMGFFRMDIDHIDKFVEIFEHLLSIHLPNLHEHLKSHGISAHIYSMDWILTLFAKTLPLDTTSRLWDNIFLEGEVFLMRTGIALLALSEEELLKSSYENTMLTLTHFPEHDEEDLFNAISDITLNIKSDKLLESYLDTISVK